MRYRYYSRGLIPVLYIYGLNLWYEFGFEQEISNAMSFHSIRLKSDRGVKSGRGMSQLDYISVWVKRGLNSQPHWIN